MRTYHFLQTRTSWSLLFQRKSFKRLSAHTINSNPVETDGNTTTIRVRGAEGAQRPIRTSTITLKYVPNAFDPTGSDDDMELGGK